MDHAAEIRKLRDRIEELEEQLREVNQVDETVIPALISSFRFTIQESKITSALLKKGRLSRLRLMHVMNEGKSYPPADSDNILNVMLRRIRNKLKESDIFVETIRGFGYEMPRASREKLQAAIAEWAQ